MWRFISLFIIMDYIKTFPVSVLRNRLQYNILLTVPRGYFFCGSFVLFITCVCHAFASVHCCLVVTWRERADLLALVCDVYCDFVTFPFGILGLVWYLIVSIPDPWGFLTLFVGKYTLMMQSLVLPLIFTAAEPRHVRFQHPILRKNLRIS